MGRKNEPSAFPVGLARNAPSEEDRVVPPDRTRAFALSQFRAAEEGDHTTILRGTRRIEELTTTDSQLNDELLLLGRHLQG